MTTEITVKVCRKCGEPKPTSEFYKESKGARARGDGFRPVCRDCWLGKEPEVTDDERKQFVKQFVIDHIKLSPISSKPASGYRIKTSHFYG